MPSVCDLLVAIDEVQSLAEPLPGQPRHSDAYAGGQAALQAACYALEMMACTYGTRLHALSLIAKDDAFSLWFYDACGVVYTTQYVSILRNFETFAAIIISIAALSHEQFGMLPPSIMIPHKPYTQQFPPERLDETTLYMPDLLTSEQVEVTLDQSIYAQYVLVGRRTFLYSVAKNSRTAQELIIKFSYQVTTRAKEEDIVAAAKRKKIAHLPDVRMSADLWRMSDGIRSAFYDAEGIKIEFEDRSLRAVSYSKYRPLQDLFVDRCDLIPVMVDQMLDCGWLPFPNHAF